MATTYVDALDGGLLVIDNDSVDVATENNADGRLVLGLRRLAEVDDSPMNTCREVYACRSQRTAFCWKQKEDQTHQGRSA